jgi:hypothetical protein
VVDPGSARLLDGITGGMPRFFTATHPAAVGSLFDAAAEAWVESELGVTVRPWQRAVLRRGLEVDGDGLLVWRTLIVSVGRQSGKTYLVRMLANLRQRLFDGPQEMLHIARDRDAARRVIVNEAFVRWAKERGIVVRTSNGQEQWRWPDGSAWDLSSIDGAYGRTAHVVMLDETWDLSRRQYFEGIQPTTAARDQAQTWMFSAAHREASDLMPLMIGRARDGRPGFALFDWGAVGGEDLSDPGVWRLMGPHWDRNRELAVSEASGEKSFAEQWANVWPAHRSAESGVPLFGEGVWDGLRIPIEGVPAVGCAVESDALSGPVVAFAGWSDGRLVVWVRQCESAAQAAAVVAGAGLCPLVGKSLMHDPVWLGVGAEPRGGTSAQAVAELRRVVDDGLLAHDGGVLLADQVDHVRVARGPSGVRLVSAARVDAIKAVVWAVERARVAEQVAAVM